MRRRSKTMWRTNSRLVAIRLSDPLPVTESVADIPHPAQTILETPTIVWELDIQFKIKPSHSRRALETLAYEA